MFNNDRGQAQAIFTAKRHYDQVTQRLSENESATPTLMFNDLIRLASGKAGANKAELMKKVSASLLLRRQYLQLVRQLAYEYSPAQAAASTSEAMPGRESDKFAIAFSRDPVVTSQVYVILTVKFPTDSHCSEGVTLHIESDDCIYQVEFPPLIDGKTQNLFEDTDPALKALTDADASIVVMN